MTAQTEARQLTDREVFFVREWTATMRTTDHVSNFLISSYDAHSYDGGKFCAYLVERGYIVRAEYEHGNAPEIDNRTAYTLTPEGVEWLLRNKVIVQAEHESAADEVEAVEEETETAALEMNEKSNFRQWAIDMQKCLAAIGACEAKEYADYDQTAFYQSCTNENEAQFERELQAAQLRRVDMFNAIRQFVAGLPRTVESQQRLAAIEAAATLSFKILCQEILGEYSDFEGVKVDTMSLPEYALYEQLMSLNADQWETVESVSERKGVNAEVLRRLLRDDVRRDQYFPSARNPQAWQLRRAEVDAWQPASVGRPASAMQADQYFEEEGKDFFVVYSVSAPWSASLSIRRNTPRGVETVASDRAAHDTPVAEMCQRVIERFNARFVSPYAAYPQGKPDSTDKLPAAFMEWFAANQLR